MDTPSTSTQFKRKRLLAVRKTFNDFSTNMTVCNIFANDFNEPVEFIQMNTFDKILTSKRILSFKVHFLRKKQCEIILSTILYRLEISFIRISSLKANTTTTTKWSTLRFCF